MQVLQDSPERLEMARGGGDGAKLTATSEVEKAMSRYLWVDKPKKHPMCLDSVPPETRNPKPYSALNPQPSTLEQDERLKPSALSPKP